MIIGFTIAQVIVACVAGLLCVVLGLANRRPNDLTIGALIIVELLLLAQLVVALISPQLGNHPTGSVGLFYVYLISALLIPPLGVCSGRSSNAQDGAPSSWGLPRSRLRSWWSGWRRSGRPSGLSTRQPTEYLG